MKMKTLRFVAALSAILGIIPSVHAQNATEAGVLGNFRKNVFNVSSVACTLSMTNGCSGGNDTGRVLNFTGTNPVVTIPANLPKGFNVDIVQGGATPVTVVAAAPGTLNKAVGMSGVTRGVNSQISLLVLSNVNGNAALTNLTGDASSIVPTIALTSVGSTGTTGSPIGFNFSYTIAAPTGMTCVWNPGSVAGGTVTSFTASVGTGGGNCPAPAAAGTYTLSVTGTGPNTAVATAASTTVVSPPAGGTITIASIAPTGTVGAPVPFTFTNTVTVPSGMTCVWNPGAVAGGAVTGFAIVNGSGSGNCPAPTTAGTYRMTATGTGANTASAIAPQTTVIAASGVCPNGSTYSDGCAAAPAGTPQLPNALSGYTAPPPFNVAGIHYHTGVASGTTLASPSTISLAGVTVNASAHTVAVTGNNVTLSGYDFGLNNGWYVTVSGANDTISNNHFKVGSNHGALGITFDELASASNLFFVNNEVDGSNIGVTVQQGYSVGFAGTGTLTVQYNYLHDSGGDMLEVQDGNWTVQNIRYNLFSNIGLQTDHSDTIQWCGSRVAAGDMAFNTFYQPNSGLSGEGQLVLNSECGPPTISVTSNLRNITVRYNTGFSLSTTPQPGTGNLDNFAFGQIITQDAGTAQGGFNATYNNYVNPAGIMSFTGSPWFPTNGPGTGTTGSTIGTPAAMHNMTNMVTGADIPPPTSSATQGGYWVYPDDNGYSPCVCDVFSITPSPATGNITTGSTVTFTVLFDAPQIVTGIPTLTLNDGGTASYTSGSGTKSLVFTHVVGSGNTAPTLAVTAINGTIKDDVGGVTKVSPLTNVTTSFAGLSVNGGTTSTFTFTTLNNASTGSTTTGGGTYSGFTLTGIAASPTYGGSCSGTATVSGFSASAGNWSATFTTPSAACSGPLTVQSVP